MWKFSLIALVLACNYPYPQSDLVWDNGGLQGSATPGVDRMAKLNVDMFCAGMAMQCEKGAKFPEKTRRINHCEACRAFCVESNMKAKPWNPSGDPIYIWPEKVDEEDCMSPGEN